MNKKLFCVAVFLVFVLVLSGCGGYPTAPSPSINEEAKVKSVINEYFSAISYQNWSKAKNLCVYGSDRYYATLAMEQYVNSLAMYGITISCLVDISNVSIYGNDAQANINLTLSMTYGGYYDTESDSGTYYLQKVGGSWKIYGP